MSRVAQQQSALDEDGSGPASTDETDQQADVTTDEAFELLSNRRRRYTLHHLTHTEGPVPLGDLAEHVASWENETTVREINAAERKRVYTSLQSHHLPKMAEQGIVEYDERAGLVELADQGEELDIYLEVVSGRDVPWSQYYLGLGAVNAAMLAAVAIGVWPFSQLPGLAWAAFAVTTFLVSALAHVYYDSSMQVGTDRKPPELRER